jgi:alpha-2-macroglobulin family protein
VHEFEELSLCSAVTQSTAAQCFSVLPDLGRYVLVAEMLLPDGQVIATTYPVGETEEQWLNAPLRSFSDAVQPRLDKPSYLIGETAYVSLHNPFRRAIMLVAVANQHETRMWRQDVPSGASQFAVEVESGVCDGGCDVLMAIFSGRDAGASLPVDVPLSHYFDPFAPSALTRALSISVLDEERSLPPLVLTVPDVVSPADRETELHLSLGPGGADLELDVCLFMVDKAWLDLKAAPSPDLPAVFATNLLPVTELTSTKLALNSALKDASNIYRSRMEEEEWVEPSDWDIYSTWGSSIDIPDEQYFAARYNRITAFPSVWEYPQVAEDLAGGGLIEEESFLDDAADGARPEAAPVPNGSPDKSGQVGAVSSSASAMPLKGELRKDSNPTPFAAPRSRVLFDERGEATISLPIPTDLGTFVITAFAVSAGSASTEMVVRKAVSLHADLPRIAHVGDRIRIGATLTVTDPTFHGDVTVYVRTDCMRLEPLEPLAKDDIAIYEHSDELAVRGAVCSARCRGGLDRGGGGGDAGAGGA